MEILYAPSRHAYLKGEKDGSCVFCRIAQNPQEDEQNFVFYRDALCFGVMNLYPYTPGHLMFIPHAHLDSPHLLVEAEWLHLSRLIRSATELLYAFGAEGINTGINIKDAGGAGIPRHLHWHILPRFAKDTNFMTTISQTRIYGCDFGAVFGEIKALAKTYL